MALRFITLASGSSGNASFVEARGFGVLIDMGIGPRLLAKRLAAGGFSWDDVQAVLLTHTHGDHWKESTLAHLARHRIPLYCHSGHVTDLQSYTQSFAKLQDAGLIQHFKPGKAFPLTNGLYCRPLPIRHDSQATFGFRLETTRDLFGEAGAIAYAADLGSWDEALVDHLIDVDLLALEFNHDVVLEKNSGRSPHLVARVLGDRGHLSNEQAARLIHRVLERSTAGRLRHVVQLHLSRQCNRPRLARAAAHRVLAQHQHVTVHTAEQDAAGQTLHVQFTLQDGCEEANRAAQAFG